MPRTRSNLSPATAPKVAEASRLSSSQNQKQDASASLSPAPKGRNIPAKGNALGSRHPANPSPEGAAQCWPFVRLAEAGVISGGLTKNSKRDSNELQVSYLRVGNVYQNELRLDEIKTIGLTEREFAKTRLEKGDLLIVEGNGSKDQIGRLAIWDGSVEPCVHQNHLIRVRLSERVLPKFAVYWFSSQEGRARIEHVASSTSGLYTLSVSKIGSLELPLPPLAEQHRIVARIEEIFSRLDAGVAALRHAKAQLQRYRQSVLAAAVTGQLTQAWREQHPDTESGEELLERILGQRREQWSGKGKYKEPGSHSANFVPHIPENWIWTGMRQVGEVQLGRQRAPQHHSGDHMRPYLRVANVFEDRLNLADVKWMNFTPEEFDRYHLQYGDLLLNEGQTPELVGRPAMYRNEISDCCYQKTLHRFRAYDGVLPQFALIVFRAYMHNGRFTAASSITTNIAHLTQQNFVEIEFPLPPLAEQHQIVAGVEARTTAIDHLDAELDLQELRSSQLRQAILKAAFAGHLYPKENYGI